VDTRINCTYQIEHQGKPTLVRVMGPVQENGERICEVFSTGELIHVPEAAFPNEEPKVWPRTQLPRRFLS
jgi:hypothetical protein